MRKKQLKIQKIGDLPLFSSKQPKNHIGQADINKTDFRAQLIERQRIRKNFLMSDRQLRAFFKESMFVFRNHRNSHSITTKALIQRLDIFIFMLSTSQRFFPTLRRIRHAIKNRQVFVNNRRERRPKFQCNPTDRIRCLKSFKESSTKPFSRIMPFALNSQQLELSLKKR